MTNWYTADTHFGHENVIPLCGRPFRGAGHMDTVLMITWNHARRDVLQIFGHVHNNWTGSRNSANAGVDVWDFMPVRFEDIARRAKSLPVNKHRADIEHNTKEI